jgi:hypothetical protein
MIRTLAEAARPPWTPYFSIAAEIVVKREIISQP